jgi:hypothetical protein
MNRLMGKHLLFAYTCQVEAGIPRGIVVYLKDVLPPLGMNAGGYHDTTAD